MDTSELYSQAEQQNIRQSPERRGRGLRVVFYGWLVVILILCGFALFARTMQHRALRTDVVAQLTGVGEANAKSVDDYIWGSQGDAIYLLERGYESPDLVRELLLCEARRCYDWQYLATGVKNYDLRQRLITHALRDFPDDPKVHWAAGQLTLLAGDWEPAQRELRKTIELADASGPRGLQRFCKSAGISVQHLRGRLAAADTLMGDWTDADKQLALAKAAGDGAPPPPLDLTYEVDTEKADRLQHAQFVALAKRYAREHDPQLLAGWIARLKALEAKPQTPDSAETEEASKLHAALARAYLLSHEWDKAAPHLKDSSEYYEYGSGAELSKLSGLLLTRLATGKKLGATAEESYKKQLAQIEQDEKQYGYYDSWSRASANQGELAGLRDLDYLPFLVRTEMFADALKRSGRKLPEVLAEVRTVTQPERDPFEDYGGLKWK